MMTSTCREERIADQLMAAKQFPESLLRIEVVSAMVGLSRTKIYEELSVGDFPEPIRLGARCTRWRAADIALHLKSIKSKKVGL